MVTFSKFFGGVANTISSSHGTLLYLPEKRGLYDLKSQSCCSTAFQRWGIGDGLANMPWTFCCSLAWSVAPDHAVAWSRADMAFR